MVETKYCPSCDTEKPAEDFSPDRARKGGRASKCRECDRARSRAYYAKHADERAAYHQANRDRRVAAMLELNTAIRASAVRVYGGACEWCGATDGLEFDHIDDDGAEHRDEEGQRAMYRRIAVTGERIADRRLRLLCRPCHRGPGWEARRAAHA